MARNSLLVAILTWCSPLPASAETTTTVYIYNADGALTSITETTEGTSGSKTTYFTWDNFEADPSSPSTGTVTAANGNLISIGSIPGGDSLSSWHYDNLDRLVRVTNAHDDSAALYEYHPDELLAASLNANAPSSDGLQHYYDESRYPQVTNLYDRYTGTSSSRYQRIRYLEDGTEQMLVRHRKDIDGVYDLGAQTMNGYGYDPYGARLGPAVMATDSHPLYDLATNPYQYTNEHHDPVSGAYYMRARWYLPAHQTFLQRDPVASLNRYGYADGNPVTNYDPSGRTAKAFFSGLEKGFLASVSFGLASAIAGAIKDPSAYFKDPRNDLLLGLGLVSTAVFLAEPLSAVFHARWIAVARRVVTPAVGVASLFLVASGTVQGLSARALAAKSSHPNGLGFSAGSVVGGLLGGVTLSGLGVLSRRVISGPLAAREVRIEVQGRFAKEGSPSPAISYRQARALVLLEAEQDRVETRASLRDLRRKAAADLGLVNAAPKDDQIEDELANIKLRRRNILRKIAGFPSKKVPLPPSNPIAPPQSLNFPEVILDAKGRPVDLRGNIIPRLEPYQPAARLQ